MKRLSIKKLEDYLVKLTKAKITDSIMKRWDLEKSH